MALNFSLKYSHDFDNDIQGIYDYIACNLNNPEAAAKHIAYIMQRTKSLMVFPKRYRVRGKNKAGHWLRYMPVRNFIVQYSVDSGMRTVNILRVFYGGRNTEVK